MKKLLFFTFPLIAVSLFLSEKVINNSVAMNSFNVSYRALEGKVKVEEKEQIIIKKPLVVTIEKQEVKITKNDALNDVEKLNFNKSLLIVEKNAANFKKRNLVTKQTIIKKKISEYSLKSNKIKFNKERKAQVNKDYIELKIEEPVKLSAFKNIKEMKRSSWSSISLNLEKYEDKIEQDLSPVELAKTKIETNKPNQNKANNVDRISTAQAATEKSKNEIISPKISNIDIRKPKVETVIKSDVKEADDLVFFDYAAEDKLKESNERTQAKTVVANNNAQTAKPSYNFQNMIFKGEDGKSKVKVSAPKLAQVKPPKNIPTVDDLIGTHKSSVIPESSTKKNNKNYKSDYSVQAYSVEEKQKISDLRNFEIRFADDIDDIRQDYSEGIVNLKDTLNTAMVVRRGTILSRNHYPTTVDFVLEDNEIAASIPVLSHDYLNGILDSEKIAGIGAFLLVELDETTEDLDLDLDTKYERKLFLDKNFKVVDRSDSDYSFILLAGVRPGNTVISFKTNKNEIVSKIIHLEKDEIYFDSNFYLVKESDDFSLAESNLLAKNKSTLSLDSKEILGLTFDAKITKQTVNRYKFGNVKYPMGTRSYIELKHLNESIFVGRWDNEEVEVPSESYIRFVLDQFAIQAVKSQCLVQINLPKAAKELYFNGQSSGRSMRMEARILDKDGIFYKDLSHESKKIFLLGEEQGIINIKIQYTDNSIDYLQSYCSSSSYLVEQL